MQKEVELRLTADKLNDDYFLEKKIRQILKINSDEQLYYKLLKKSLDARKGRPKFLLRFLTSTTTMPESPLEALNINYQSKHSKSILIIGAGPAGYFAALQCIELGYQPIVVDRGKDVRERRKDLRAIQQLGEVNPNSNYCYGEGGAGTYSDGKLYTRAKKRGKIIKILKILLDHGAPAAIAYDAHPHIGSNKLPGIISNIRETILSNGGEVHFNSQVTDLIIKDKKCLGAIVNNDREYLADETILATGHSARDIYQLLDDRRVKLEAKPFALGVRIEHPQELIDEIQYKQNPREEGLPAASYALTAQVGSIGVFSFCMCPGGLIVPAATSPGEIVVNGMSLSKRNSPFANSGIVTALSNDELINQGFDGVFGNLNFQKSVEQSLFQQGDGSMKAPAQNLIDFVTGQDMIEVNSSSYIPGVYRAPLHALLPEFVYQRLKAGLAAFAHKMKGFYTNEANVIAVESRTSAPIKIPRENDSCEHPEIKSLYPCGEGAGFAGGILSAAMDGQRVVKAIHVKSI